MPKIAAKAAAKITVLVSGGGTNLQAIIEAIDSGVLNCSIGVVIADRECYALERSRLAGIPTHLCPRKVLGQGLSEEVSRLISEDCELIVLAGYLSILSNGFIQKWPGKIINLHPSLLPRHGGAGMWGIKVHEAVIAAGDQLSGCTVHYVDNAIDSGEIIAQSSLSVQPQETATSLQARVSELEHPLLIAVIAKLLA